MRILAFISVLLFLASCNLDENMFNPDTGISSYQLDNYTGETDIEVGPAYDIADSNIYLFKIPKSIERGYDLWAVYVGDTARIKSDTVILYCHGNRDHMDFYWPRAKLLANIGAKHRYGVLMIEYQGFGLSGGEASQDNLVSDTEEAMQWLLSKGLSDSRLIIYGFSLGSYPATYFTANPTDLNPAILVLENPFASTDVMLQDASGLAMPSEFVTTASFNNVDLIKSVYQPFIWFHGIEDDFLNMETHGEVVYKNYRGPRSKAIRVDGGTHSNVPYAYGYDNYLNELSTFFRGQ